MGTTPLWVPLAAAAIAVVGTISGVVFTQVWNGRLEERRSAREKDRLRETQAREDLNRSYEHRRAAYVDYLEELNRLLDLVDSRRDDPDGPPPEPMDSAFDQLRERFTLVTVYGTPEASDLAWRCVDGFYEYVDNLDEESGDYGVHDARAAYLKQIRRDLGVPDKDLGVPE